LLEGAKTAHSNVQHEKVWCGCHFKRATLESHNARDTLQNMTPSILQSHKIMALFGCSMALGNSQTGFEEGKVKQSYSG